jgi:hypothetical protein
MTVAAETRCASVFVYSLELKVAPWVASPTLPAHPSTPPPMVPSSAPAPILMNDLLVIELPLMGFPPRADPLSLSVPS